MVSASPDESGIEHGILETEWYHLGKWLAPAISAYLWLEYGKVAQDFFKGKLDGKLLYLDGDFFLSKHDSDILRTESYEAAKKGDRAFFQRIYNLVKATTDEMLREADDVEDPVGFLERYKRLTGVWMPLNNIALGIERYVQESNPEAFAMAKGFLDEKPLTLQQMDEMLELKGMIERMTGKRMDEVEELPAELDEAVRTHVRKYEWLGTHSFNIGRFTREKLVEQMRQGKAKASPMHMEGDEELAYVLWLLDLIGFVRFKAAETSGYTTYHLKDRLTAIAEEKGLTYDDIVEHTLPEIASGEISKETAEKRRKETGFYFDGSIHILAGTLMKTCAERLLGGKGERTKELRGTVAQKGKVQGRVKIVIRQEQMKGFEEGMVLVAHETTPDIIFAMQKSSAIVTDFGGLTSHAAIVARELKKPCIVGTKFATTMLKDGDEVEVDADNGVVRTHEITILHQRSSEKNRLASEILRKKRGKALEERNHEQGA